MSAPNPKPADVISAETLEKLKNLDLPDDYVPPPPEPKTNRPMVWMSPATKAALEHAKAAVRKVNENK